MNWLNTGLKKAKQMMIDSDIEAAPAIEGGMTKEEEAVLTEKHSESRFEQNPNEVVVGKGDKTAYLLRDAAKAVEWVDRLFIFDPNNGFAALPNANLIDPTGKIDLQHKINIFNLSDGNKEARKNFALKMFEQMERAVFASRYEKVGIYIDEIESLDESLQHQLHTMSKKIRSYQGFLCIAFKQVPQPTEPPGRLFWNAKYFSFFTLTHSDTDELEKEEMIQSHESDRLIGRRQHDPFLQIAGNQRYWRKV